MDPRYNEMIIARARLEEQSGEYRSRTHRLAKWKELVTEAQRGLELPDEAPQSIQ